MPEKLTRNPHAETVQNQGAAWPRSQGPGSRSLLAAIFQEQLLNDPTSQA